MSEQTKGEREQEIKDAFAGRNGWRRVTTDKEVREALDEAWEKMGRGAFDER